MFPGDVAGSVWTRRRSAFPFPQTGGQEQMGQLIRSKPTAGAGVSLFALNALVEDAVHVYADAPASRYTRCS